VFFSVYNTRRWAESINPAILNVIRHRQNPLDSSRVDAMMQRQQIMSPVFRETLLYIKYRFMGWKNRTHARDKICIQKF
jgi:hypothetical protein